MRMVLVDPPEAQAARLIGRPTWRWFDIRRWGKRRVGVAAVIVVYACLGTVNALTVPPFLPRDETGHLSYVVHVTHGRLPTIYTPLPKADLPQLRSNHKDTTWVANHPPLFYVLAAGPMKLALYLDRPMLGLRLIRLMNIGYVAMTMLMAAVMARRLVRQSVRAPIVAAATCGLVAAVPHVATLAYNDALAMCTAAAVLVAAVAVFDRGPSVRGLAWVATTASAAALTRFTNLPVIAAAAAIVTFSVLRHTRGPLTRKAAELGRTGGIIAVPVALTSAWFYLRNRRLYGDYTGAHALFVMFHRRPQGSALTYLQSGTFWRSLHDGMWTPYSGRGWAPIYGHGRAFTVLLVLGLACAAARWVWLRVPRSLPTTWRPDFSLFLVAVALIALFAAMVAQFQSGGGGGHSRYLFPLLPVVGCFAALAWACLPGNRRGILSALALLAAVGLASDLLHRFLTIRTGNDGWVGTEINALGKGVPAPAAVLTVLLLVLGVALAVALWVLIVLPEEEVLRRRPSFSDPPPASPSGPRDPDPDPAGCPESDQIFDLPLR